MRTESDREMLERLREIRCGQRPVKRNRPELYPLMAPFLPPGTAQKLLDEVRGDR